MNHDDLAAVSNLCEALHSDMREKVYDPLTVQDVFDLLLPFRDKKDLLYSRSWAKRGLMGYWAGAIGRAVDRLDGVMTGLVRAAINKDAKASKTATLYVMDTLLDINMYALMGLTLLANLDPSAWKSFVENLEDHLSGKPS